MKITCLEALVRPEQPYLLTNDISTAHCVGILECLPNSVKLASHDKGQLGTKESEPELYETNHDKCWMNSRADASVITDVCNRADLPEVEILSLLEEQIPKYKLRADTITDFRGYDNEDWIQTPLIPLDDDLELTTEQIEETLKYFILCAQRVTQMTRTYNDIEAVTRLLEEKERDLELAARIGQTLLEKNKELSDKADHLEDQLSAANDKVSQLKHDLSMKDELLRFYTQDLENAESESDSSTPTQQQPSSSGADSRVKSFNLSSINVDNLKKKVRLLEDDNLQLRLETSQLASVTEDYEEKEEKLVQDCLKQLADVNSQLEVFSDELARKTEESSRQKEEITSLLSQVVDLQRKNREVSVENLDYSKKLEAFKDTQHKLAKELSEWQDRYDELLELFEEVQDELRTLRRKHKPSASKHYMSTSSLMRGDSLASELESSMRGEIEYPAGYSPAERRIHNWKIFETARAAKKASQRMKDKRSSSLFLKAAGGDSSTPGSASVSVRSSLYLSDGESFISDGYNADLDSMSGWPPFRAYSSNSTNIGRPGVPGSNDLETALRRLLVKRPWDINDKDGKSSSDSSKENEKTQISLDPTFSDGFSTPMLSGTPESMLSSGVSALSATGSAGLHFKIPEKLQIVKPMEGSVTLKHWQQLAQPHMTGIFESRPGVQIKGERKLDLEEEVYNLSDYEEDDDYQLCHSKRFAESSTIYTYTDSMVMHPSDQVYLDEKQSDNNSSIKRLWDLERKKAKDRKLLQKPKHGNKDMGEPPAACSRKSTRKTADTTTCSMSLGLAAILNERGLCDTWKFGLRCKGNSVSPGGDGTSSDDSHSGIYTRSGGSSSDATPTHFYRKKKSSSEVKETKDDGNANSSSVDALDSSSEVGAKTQSAGASFLSTLKSKGFSIYGILSSSSSASTENNNSVGEAITTDSSIDSTLKCTTATDGAASPTSTATTTTTTTNNTTIINDNNNSSRDSNRSNNNSSPSATTANDIALGKSGGVLGAITSLRQGGIL
ncbi:trafficking kinesin-binding protein 1 isoform X5 [Octopus bimaculoides]|uniref:trafficking kinesin-binding protein 1 isoform X5 n=1 Tax=Octopus bimaculoides TaxID=37653 RepID=UPI00071D8A2C|nr:trafficking kinesin-binding protein 1 isoform X5 [Octopus bimaculoides]|eukprot:XP_014779128.1 PREDICTED: trafficking kinesin-binding protein 1-like isoform X5 [Octopus bimaculoides]